MSDYLCFLMVAAAVLVAGWLIIDRWVIRPLSRWRERQYDQTAAILRQQGVDLAVFNQQQWRQFIVKLKQQAGSGSCNGIWVKQVQLLAEFRFGLDPHYHTDLSDPVEPKPTSTISKAH